MQTLNFSSTETEILEASEDDLAAYYREFEQRSEENAGSVRLFEDFAVKRKFGLSKREYRNLEFAWQHFNGPELRVPRPIRFFQRAKDGEVPMGFIVMEYLDGKTLEACEIGADTIKKVFTAIQSIHKKSRGMRGGQPGPLDDGIAEGFPWGNDDAGTAFNSVGDFLRCAEQRLSKYLKRMRIRQTSTMLKLQDAQLVACHLDLYPRNMIELPGTIGFVDWEWLAFYPLEVEIAALSYARNSGMDVNFFHDLMEQFSLPNESWELVSKLECIHQSSVLNAF